MGPRLMCRGATVLRTMSGTRLTGFNGAAADVPRSAKGNYDSAESMAASMGPRLMCRGAPLRKEFADEVRSFNGAAADVPRSGRRSISNKDNSLYNELRAAGGLELGLSSMTHFVSVELSEHSDVRTSERSPGNGDHFVARG